MGNVVSAEALRQWNQENENTALVDNYVSMQGAVSAGIYGDDTADASLFGITSQVDLNRYWSGGQEAYGGVPYMTGAESAASNWINLYNPEDQATSIAWRTNNKAKPVFSSNFSDVWEYRYFWTSDAAPPILYRRVHKETLAFTDLTTTPDGYEIIAFISAATSMPIGTKEYDEWFQVNTNLKNIGMPEEDAGIGQNHSFQFNHDAAATWPFWLHIRQQTSFDTTY